MAAAASWCAWLATTLAVSLGAAPSARAEHGDPLVVPAPASGSALPVNALLRLESHNGLASPLPEIAAGERGYAATLVASDHRIALAPVTWWEDGEGGYGTGLLVLRPARRLRPGATYRLELTWPDATADEIDTGWTWTAVDSVDRTPPRWTGAATAGAPLEDIPADEPVVDAGLRLEASVVEVVAELIPVGAGRRREVRLTFDATRDCDVGPTTDYTLAIFASSCPQAQAARMCQTAYRFDLDAAIGRRFRVALTAIDVAGNRRRAPGPPPMITWAGASSLTVCVPLPPAPPPTPAPP